MSQHAPRRDSFLIAISIVMVGMLSVSCEREQARADWWQGEQDRIGLIQQMELARYRIQHVQASGLDKVAKLNTRIEADTVLLRSLHQQKQASSAEVATLEDRRIGLRESMIREHRQRVQGRTFSVMSSTSGRQYNEVKISRIDDAGVTILHADGSARLRYGDLDPGQRQLFALEEDLALAAEAREANETAAYEREIENQMAVIRERERREEITRRDEQASVRAAAFQLASLQASNRESLFSQTSVPVVNRYDGYFSYYPGYRYRRPTYRTIYTYHAPSYIGNCRSVVTAPTRRAAGYGTISKPVAFRYR